MSQPVLVALLIGSVLVGCWPSPMDNRGTKAVPPASRGKEVRDLEKALAEAKNKPPAPATQAAAPASAEAPASEAAPASGATAPSELVPAAPSGVEGAAPAAPPPASN